MNKKTAYWICQAIGWSGIIVIEVSNYTFFLLQRFEPAILYQMSISAVLGLLITHAYRYFLKRTRYFEKHHRFIWVFAFISTAILSTIQAVFNYIPGLFTDFRDTIQSFRWIEFIGYTYNYMRYYGVWVIIYFLYKILQQNHAINQEKLKAENTARTAELELLKTQLNPHFLFNALNSIKALVSIDPEQSRDAIVKLSELLRFTLQYNKEQEIPLYEEMEEVKKYLELEELRFGERLKVQYKIPDDAIHCQLPPAVLLTLAENAVKHGISQSVKPGEITVEALVSGNVLTIKMTNTGNYAPGEKVGIGLLHIRRRLEELYGNKAVLSLENNDNRVFATLQIPQ
jgi:two-component system, LytTR family, sensor kinase